MSKKHAPLPRRPEPPSVEQIMKDIEGSSANDVVFTSLNSGVIGEDSPDPMTESFASIDDGFSSPNLQNNLENNISDDTKGVETTYRDAVRFIKLIKDLESTPDKLQEKCEQLQSLGSELDTSISDLKRQSQTALDKSLSRT